MFKVPDWGSDIPKSDVEMTKLFTKICKRKNTKTNVQPKNKCNVINKNTSKKKRNMNTLIKAKNTTNGHSSFSKDDHIQNRILRRNLKMNSIGTKNNDKSDTEKSTANVISNQKLQNKVLKRKEKVSRSTQKLKLASDSVIVKQPNTKKQDKNHSKRLSNINREPNPMKRQLTLSNNEHEDIELNNSDLLNLNSDEPDKLLVNAKRKKLNDKIKNDDVEDVLFGIKTNEEENFNNHNVVISSKENRILKKKEKLKKLLKRDSNRNVIRITNSNLRERMLEKLKAAQFRYLNEKLYTSSGSESQELFKSDPSAFQTYHEGYQLQVKKWPVNPLDLIVKRIQKMPKTHLIADMGCGEAALSKRVPQAVRSFDLVATTPDVEVCNMAHTPLLTASMDVVVFCLALMGTDLTQYLLEANRILKLEGHLLIAEVESRFENVDSFSSEVQRLGFSLKKLDKSHQVFFFMEFSKARDAPAKRGKLPTLSLKPCLYKRR